LCLQLAVLRPLLLLLLMALMEIPNCLGLLLLQLVLLREVPCLH
jgi:hypothetical protein